MLPPTELTPLEYVYSNAEIRNLKELIRRRRYFGLPFWFLRKELNKIGLGGLPRNSEFERSFDAAAAYSARPPGRSDAFARIADAKTWSGLINVLERESEHDRVMLTQIREFMRGRRASAYQKSISPELEKRLANLKIGRDFDLIKAGARRLEISHRHRNNEGAPGRGRSINGLIEGLASIFARYTGARPRELSSSENSVFVQFVLAALEPHPGIDRSVKDLAVIARRWERLKNVPEDKGENS